MGTGSINGMGGGVEHADVRIVIVGQDRGIHFPDQLLLEIGDLLQLCWIELLRVLEITQRLLSNREGTQDRGGILPLRIGNLLPQRSKSLIHGLAFVRS